MTENNLIQAVADDIMAAKYSVRYLRVSTARQMDTDADVVQDGNSIDTQRKATIIKEQALGLTNAKEFIEPGNSAQTIEKRPVFRELLAYLTEHPEIKYVIVYMMSRAFRNLRDQLNTKAQLEKMGVKLISAKEDFTDDYLGDAMQMLIGVINEVESRRSGEDIKVKMANKAKNGGTIGRAKIGYLNIRKRVDGREVRTIATDSERAPFVRTAFELFATGRYTAETLQEHLTDAGLRLPATAKWPERPISENTLYNLLRDRYYLGEIKVDGVWLTNGRHEPLVTPELFDRVQRVLDAHSGAGTRQRTHHHFLKGTIFCGRCSRRFVVQRAVGNGGEYFYFLCRGKQGGECDQPYVPVEVIEQAVEEHYGRVAWLPASLHDQLRQAAADARATNSSLSPEARHGLERRKAAISKKEDYFLDLAADEDWPKDKLRAKVQALRDERRQIERTIQHADTQLATGSSILDHALELLAQPHQLYAESSEAVRTILNRAFFRKLYVDGRKISGQDWQEPFDVLHELYEIEREGRTARPRTSSKAGLPKETGLADRTVIDLLTRDLGRGWSRAVMVGDTGIEPVTSSV